jgi:mRNA interferase RelE/StbE
MRRVLDAIDRLCAEDAAGDVRRLAGRPEFRLRVGDWRVLFVRDDERRAVRVLRVLPRGRAYDR